MYDILIKKNYFKVYNLLLLFPERKNLTWFCVPKWGPKSTIFKSFVNLDSSSISPRYLTCFKIYICRPLILKLSFFCYVFALWSKVDISALSTLIDFLLALSQWTINFKLWFTYLFAFFMELLEYERFVSSAKWCISEC